jgi:hypothetical protein
MTDAPNAAGLAALEAELARDFARLNHPPAEWTPETEGPDGRPAADVLIVGAGMNGLAAAFALRRLGISRILHVDRSAEGREGPWLTYARMELLRSPKHLTGPAQGIAALTFRAWWEAQHGAGGWERLGYIRREDWAAYLAWLRRATGARVENGVELVSIDADDRFVTAQLRDGGRARRPRPPRRAGDGARGAVSTAHPGLLRALPRGAGRAYGGPDRLRRARRAARGGDRAGGLGFRQRLHGGGGGRIGHADRPGRGAAAAQQDEEHGLSRLRPRLSRPARRGPARLAAPHRRRAHRAAAPHRAARRAGGRAGDAGGRRWRGWRRPATGCES